MRIESYLQQHQEIGKEIETIETLVIENSIEENAMDIALHISTLAGKLKVHLSMEDSYLYPELSNRSDSKISEKALQYQQKMGDLASIFTSYKNSYNTKTKILTSASDFKKDTANVLKALKTRVACEEKELYPLV